MNPDIAIIGGGPAGLVLAISLARRGIPSIVFEAMDDPTRLEKFNPSRSYAIDITGHGLKAIRHIDAVDDFNRTLIPFNGMKLNGRVVDTWDEPGWIASRGDIVTVLTELALRDYADFIDIRFQCRLDKIDIHHGEFDIRQAEQDIEHCGPFDLVVAADGGGSKVREQAEQQDRNYQLTREDTAYYFKMLAMDQNTEDLDSNYLEVLSKATIMAAGAINGPGGKEDPLWFCAVAYRNDQRYPSVEAVKVDLAKRAPGVLKYCSDNALEAFSNLPAQNIGRITSASQLYGGRVAFLGDAAISYPPIGQGINGAMESAMVLDKVLAEHVKGETWSASSVQAALATYSDAWLPETRAVSWFGKKINQANRWHVIRAMLLEALRIPVLHNAKSSTLPYSEAQRRAKWLGPLWFG